MSSRPARIQRVLKVRDDKLKQAVLALEQARVAEHRARAELEQAASARREAESARRELAVRGGDMRSFLEAEDWLKSCSVGEVLAVRRLRQAQASFEKAQLRVKDARVKVRQLEQLAERWKQLGIAKERRSERMLEDEVGQRIAQLRRRRAT